MAPTGSSMPSTGQSTRVTATATWSPSKNNARCPNKTKCSSGPRRPCELSARPTSARPRDRRLQLLAHGFRLNRSGGNNEEDEEDQEDQDKDNDQGPSIFDKFGAPGNKDAYVAAMNEEGINLQLVAAVRMQSINANNRSVSAGQPRYQLQGIWAGMPLESFNRVRYWRLHPVPTTAKLVVGQEPAASVVPGHEEAPPSWPQASMPTHPLSFYYESVVGSEAAKVWPNSEALSARTMWNAMTKDQQAVYEKACEDRRQA
ncbi:hypothetical protein SEUCBS140593_007062 [Sporothrix eucalyptigena]|uniref:HMG box domain-containing protein n=1 Tax=Sporothrix eucalyptigena TaxID=1812306 RepID=A0ABP0CCK8_9PEZI